MSEPIRVVVADDHPVYRNGLASTIRDADATVLVGTAADGADAIALAHSEKPDVILMDVRMPGVNGIDATARIGRNRNREKRSAASLARLTSPSNPGWLRALSPPTAFTLAVAPQSHSAVGALGLSARRA